MTWYAAHIVMYVELQDRPQQRFPVWENVVAIRAENEAEAFEKAEQYGRAEEGNDGGSFHWGKSRARWVFAGVRKLYESAFVGNAANDGVELTYTEYELGSRDDVKRLAAGKQVQATFNDNYRCAQTKTDKTVGQSKSAKRKRA